MALLCLGGVGVFVSLYDGATEIKRSAPDAVADSFLRAYLVNRDDREVSLYACRSGGDFAAISSLRTELIKREHDFGVTVAVSVRPRRGGPGVKRSVEWVRDVTKSGRAAVSDVDDTGAVLAQWMIQTLGPAATGPAWKNWLLPSERRLSPARFGNECCICSTTR